MVRWTAPNARSQTAGVVKSTRGIDGILPILLDGAPVSPDLRGFVEQEERDAYAAAFPLIHAELGAEDLHLTLTMPGQKQAKKVYQTKSGYWYFKVKHKDGYPVKPILEIPGFWDKEQIIRHMEELHTDYCILRCKLADFYA